MEENKEVINEQEFKEVETNDYISTPEEIEKRKEEFIKMYNENPQIEDTYISSEAPTDEDKEMFKKQYEEKITAVNNQNYLIEGNKDKAIEIAKFIKMFNKLFSSWDKTSVGGVNKMNEYIDEQINDIKSGKKENLSFDYGALIVSYSTMQNPKGVGLKQAQELLKHEDMYNKVFGIIESYIESLKDANKVINNLQARWAAAEQGFLILVKDGENDQIIKDPFK